MNTSIALGKIIGLSFFLISICLIINKRAFLSFMNLSRSKEFTLCLGFLFSFLGVIVISIHNIWEFNWKGLVTILGWLFVVEGLFRILFIDLVVELFKTKDSYLAMKMSLALTLIIGIYLILVTF